MAIDALIGEEEHNRKQKGKHKKETGLCFEVRRGIRQGYVMPTCLFNDRVVGRVNERLAGRGVK